MGGSDAEGIQRGERAELHQLSVEPDRFATTSEAVKRNNACIPDQDIAACCHRKEATAHCAPAVAARESLWSSAVSEVIGPAITPLAPTGEIRC
jgi:hypothetical protein